jgi:hypothetical protein
LFGGFDVLLLGFLVSAAEKHDEKRTALHEVDAITGPVLNAKFADAFTDGLHVTRIAKGETTDASGDSGFGVRIAESCQPAREGLRFAEFDPWVIVAYKLQLVIRPLLYPAHCCGMERGTRLALTMKLREDAAATFALDMGTRPDRRNTVDGAHGRVAYRTDARMINPMY